MDNVTIFDGFRTVEQNCVVIEKHEKRNSKTRQVNTYGWVNYNGKKILAEYINPSNGWWARTV